MTNEYPPAPDIPARLLSKDQELALSDLDTTNTHNDFVKALRFIMSQSLEKTNTFRNPILSGFNPDPSICYVPGKGYFVSTSTFEYFPGLPIYHSTDLISWKVSTFSDNRARADSQLIGHAINRRSQGVDMRTVESSAGLWAPTFRYNKGKWYMICSCFWRLRISQVSV